MNAEDYVVDEDFNRTADDNRLIDDTHGDLRPNDLLKSPQEQEFAGLATAIHQHAPSLTPEQLEQAVRWLKIWKQKKNPRAEQRSVWDYHEWLDIVRNTREQLRMQNRALLQLGVAGLFASAAVIVLVVATAVNYSVDDLSWGWKIFNLALVFGFLAGVKKYTLKGLMTSKEQDRRYLMASIREARTASEVAASGLFAYLPGTIWKEGQKGDNVRAHTEMRAAREQLADALYHDPDDHLGPWSTLLRD
jgi:hypothetical protein